MEKPLLRAAVRAGCGGLAGSETAGDGGGVLVCCTTAGDSVLTAGLIVCSCLFGVETELWFSGAAEGFGALVFTALLVAAEPWLFLAGTSSGWSFFFFVAGRCSQTEKRNFH